MTADQIVQAHAARTIARMESSRLAIAEQRRVADAKYDEATAHLNSIAFGIVERAPDANTTPGEENPDARAGGNAATPARSAPDRASADA